MKISYAIPVCNEHIELEKLLGVLHQHIGEEDEIIVRQRKSYFEHGGAFWYSLKIDYQGRYIELLNRGSSCYPYKKFSHMSEQFRNTLKKLTY